MNLNGGYIIINKDDTNIYAKANEALTNGKPILWYENDTTCYYIDTIALSGDDIVLTKGGKTITITDANAVSESGNIQLLKEDLFTVVDLSEYDLSSTINSSADIGDANEITEEIRDALFEKIENSINSGKPIMIIAKGLYDSSTNLKRAFFVDAFCDGVIIAFAYTDYADDATYYIGVYEYSDKYYISAGNSLWYF